MRLKTAVFLFIFLIATPNLVHGQNNYTYVPSDNIAQCLSQKKDLVLENDGEEKSNANFSDCVALAEYNNDNNDLAWVQLSWYRTMVFHNEDERPLHDSLENELISATKSGNLIPSLVGNIYHQIATHKIKGAQFHQGLKHLFDAIEIEKEIGDTNAIIKNYVQVLTIYAQLKDGYHMKEYHEEALTYLPNANNYWKGIYYLKLYDLRPIFDVEERAVYLKKSLRILDQSNSRSKHIIVFLNLAQYYQYAGKMDSSLYYIEKAKKEINNTPPEKRKIYPIHIKTAEGLYYHDIGEYEKGIGLIREAISMCAKNGIHIQRINLLELISKLANKKRDYKTAYESQKLVNDINDSLRSYKRIKQYENLMVQYDTEKKDKTIVSLEQEKEIKDSLLKKKDQSNVYLGWGLMLSMLLVVTIIIMYIQKRKDSKKLDSLNTLKDEIFSVLSHDLRSPLYSFSQLIELGKKNFISKEQFDQYLGELQSELMNTNNLVQSLLRWAHSNRQMLEVSITEVDISDTITEVTQLYKPEFKRKNIDLFKNVEPGIYIETDADLLQFILRNILSNALKFSADHKEIKVSVKDYKDHVSIIIKDQGKGLTNQQIEDFHQGRLKPGIDEKGEKSIGLGLLLCKDFADKLDIQIQLDSSSVGTTFILTIQKLTIE